ncbi:uncharacterized protein LOC111083599 [Limulus polyphemus]|uniref:Uncharacterized protein LOC111083599 n=1 Tax=Limulus polyphemus TaxID=6850 RepID=A0ABM1RX23_LIMPO|nr:uncharacterized protein LOC111083599 [Limulus polyphemus]
MTSGDSSISTQEASSPQNLFFAKFTQGDQGSQNTSTRTSRLIYGGPLSTVRDVEEENSDASLISDVDQKRGRLDPAGGLLIDFENPDQLESDRPKSSGYTSCATLSDLPSQLCTPNVESQSFPHSASHSSGYHSITEEEAVGKEIYRDHREFAGCLNSTGPKKRSFRSHEFPFELKMLNLIENPLSDQTFNRNLIASGKSRSHSWDRASQRKDVVGYPLYSKTTMLSEIGQQKSKTSPREVRKRERQQKSPHKKWSITGSPGRSKVEQNNWELCMYVFGGRERGVPIVTRQPITVWKFYV